MEANVQFEKAIKISQTRKKTKKVEKKGNWIHFISKIGLVIVFIGYVIITMTVWGDKF